MISPVDKVRISGKICVLVQGKSMYDLRLKT